MPIFVYAVVNPDGSDGAEFEIEQAPGDAPLTRHPLTGEPLRRVYSAPGLATHYSDGEIKRMVGDEAYISSRGFTKYERDPATGVYHKIAGTDPAAPETFSKPRGNELLPGEDRLIHGNAGENHPCGNARRHEHGNGCNCGHCH